MTSLTITLFVVVLEVVIRTSKCEILNHPNFHLYTQANYQNPVQGLVVYVPVCRPDCYPSSHLQSQSHLTPICSEKAHIGNLPLEQQVQTYSSTDSERPSTSIYQTSHNQGLSQNYHLSGDISNSKQSSGGVTIIQQTINHGTDHHGSGVSHQIFRQEHQQDHYSDFENGGHDYDHDQSEELHHKKNHNVNYKFEYSVHDQKTGDVKRQSEERKGDVVNGEYSLLEEDGNVRTVKYYADWKSGFHAQVQNSKPKSLG